MPDVLIRDLDPAVLDEIHEVLRDAARFRAAGTRELVTAWHRRLAGRRFSDSAKLIREDRDER
jgi:hypothetical protein